MRRSVVFLPLLFIAALLASCSQPGGPTGPVAAGGSPNAACPPGWLRVSHQAWVQEDRNGDGRVDFPQTEPASGGGHIHAEACEPAFLAHGSTVSLRVDLMSHQGFTGHGDKLDLGLSPDGHSLGSSPAPDLHCGAKPAACHFTGRQATTVTANGIPGGDQALRLRYLRAELDNGERWYLSSQVPVGGNGSEWGGLCGKSWLGEYAVACFHDGSLFRKVLSGTVTVPVWSKGDHVNAVSVHTDARFGADSEGRTWAVRGGQFRGGVSLDTTQLSNGWHCLAIRTDAAGGGNRVHTGIIEVGIQVHNDGRPAGNGTGGCFPMVS